MWMTPYSFIEIWFRVFNQKSFLAGGIIFGGIQYLRKHEDVFRQLLITICIWLFLLTAFIDKMVKRGQNYVHVKIECPP